MILDTTTELTAAKGVLSFNKRLAITILSIIVISVYSITIGFDFVNVDDNTLIIGNPIINKPSVPYYTSFGKFIFSAHYKPLVFLSWKAEYQLLGSGAWHFHLINWLLHWANTILLFLIGLIFFRNLYTDEKKTLISSFFLALIFAINPLRVESVAWATERKDVLFGFFILLSWLAYYRYLESKKYYYLIIGACLYLLSGLSKSMGIPFVAVLFLLDMWHKRAFSIGIIKEKIPYIVALAGLLILYGFANSLAEEGPRKIISNGHTVYKYYNITGLSYINELPYWIQAIVTASARFVLWIGHNFIPWKLSLIYSHDRIYGWFGKFIFVTPFIISAIYVYAWLIRKRAPYLIWGLLFFGITISPVLIQLSAGQMVFIADRYMYIPCIGLFIIIIGFINDIRIKKEIAYSILFSICAIYIIITVNYLQCWKNSETLFSRVLKISPDIGIGYQNLGFYYKSEKNNHDKALEMYSLGIKRVPNYKDLYVNRSKIYIDDGRADLAIADLNYALRLDSRHVRSYCNRAIAYKMMNQNDNALEDYNKANSIDPNRSDVLLNRSALLLELGQFEKALQDCRSYDKYFYENAYITDRTGICFMKLGKNDSALYYFNKAIIAKPSEASFLVNRANLLHKTGHSQKAIEEVKEAKKLGFSSSDSLLQIYTQSSGKSVN